MATWQADFRLLPTDGWPSDYRDQLNRFLPPATTWTPSIEMWGVEDGNRIDVVLEDGQPVEGLARVDLRDWSLSFIIGLTEFARQAKLRIETESGVPLEPSRAAVAMALRTSPAFRFVDDPVHFLDQLAGGGPSEEPRETTG